MLYDDEQKILTAKRLKKLRESKKDINGKKYSYATLQEELANKYVVGVITSKTLSNYEITNKNNKNFHAGKSMKLENLYMLADYYNVSSDYLLGIENHKTNNINELGLEIGLDEESIHKLKAVAGDVNFRELIETINNIIHSIDISSSYNNTDESMLEDNISLNKKRNFITPSFLESLSKYLNFRCEKQYIRISANNYSDEWFDRWLDEFGQLNLSEEEVSNILLLELQKMIVDSRNRYKPLREASKKNSKKFFNKSKRKREKEFKEKEGKEKDIKEKNDA